MNRWLRSAVGLVAFACGACAPQAGADPGPGPALGPFAVDLATATGGYPEREHVLRSAEEQLVEQCMRAQGQIYWPFVPEAGPGSDEERIVDLPSRQTKGYRLAAADGQEPSAGPTSETPEFEKALFGVGRRYEELPLPNGMIVGYPTSGCAADSRAALYGDNRSWARVDSLPQLVNNTLREQVTDSNRLAAVTAQWSNCMTAAGYHYASPQDAIDNVARPGPKPVGFDREVATADGKCQLEVHLPATEIELRRAAAQSLASQIRAELVELTAIHCSAYRRAAAIVGVDAADCQ